MHEKSVETYEHAWKSMKSGLLEDWHKQVWVEADTNDWIRGGRSEASTHSKGILHFIAPLCQVATCHQLPCGIRCPLRCLCRCILEAQWILRASRDPANMQNHQENRSSSKLLRKDDGHAWGFLSLCIRSIYIVIFCQEPPKPAEKLAHRFFSELSPPWTF